MHLSPLSGSASPDPDKAEALPAHTVLAEGNYVIERTIGRGGFGVTYLARDLTLDRAVVIKECFPELICMRSGPNVVATRRETAAQFKKCIEMFIREARSIARLMHPNIIKVHAVFEQNQTAYMVLDLVEGDDLFTIADDPDHHLSPAEIKSIALQILDALSVVHDHNLLHRDISPDNILLDKTGKPVLIDFGSAKELASERGRAKTAFLFVKDGYSPFEFYVRGAAHSPASDLYALGGTLYHLVTGNPPPDSQTRQSEIMAGHPDPYLPLIGRFTGYEPLFLSAIDKALSLRMDQRFQYALDWYGVITRQNTEEPAASWKPTTSPDSLLQDIVAETNRHVRGDAQGRTDAVMRLDGLEADARRPVWRDEFNQETQEIAAREAARRAGQEDDDVDIPAEEASPDRLRSSLATSIPGMPDPAEQEREKALIELYFKHKNKHKRKREARRQVKRALVYFALSASAIALVAYVAVNYERMQEDGTWEVLFSSEGLCTNETLRAISPVTVNCEGRGEARRLDLNDRQRILDMERANRFDLN